MRKFTLLLLSLALAFTASAKTLTIAVLDNAPTLDPHATFNGYSFGVTNQVYENLVRLTPEAEVIPGLAESWSYPDEYTLRLSLREGVSFHDGTLFNAEAAKASIDRFLADETAGPGRFVLTAITDAVVVDEYTLDLVTDPPFAPLLAHLAHPTAAIVPVGDYDLARHPVGTGPFVFDSWTVGSEINLVANDDYWGGRPQIDQVRMRVIPEMSTQIVELRSGGVDMIFGLPADNYASVKGDENLVATDFYGWGTYVLGFNADNPKLADVRVRQALAHMVDKSLIADVLLDGQAAPGVSAIPPTVRFALDMEDPYPYNPERAKELLAEAGVESLKLRFDGSADPQVEAIAQVLQFEFSEIGVDLEIRMQPYAAYAEATARDDLELYFMTWGTVTLDADYALYAFYHSSQIPDNNYSRYRNDEVDAQLELARESSDPDVRAAAYAFVQEETLTDATQIAVVYPKSNYVKTNRLNGEILPFSWINLDLRNATLE